MGRLIDADKFLERVKKDREHEIYLHSWTADMVLKRLDSWYAPTVEAISKADYEARLKADMVAMLEELQSEIEEKEQYYQDKFLESRNAVHDAAMGGRMFGCGECKEVIQQRINTLKGDSND